MTKSTFILDFSNHISISFHLVNNYKFDLLLKLSFHYVSLPKVPNILISGSKQKSKHLEESRSKGSLNSPGFISLRGYKEKGNT